MNERFDSYEWQSQNRPATTPAMLAERAMLAVRATLEKSGNLLAGSSQSMSLPLPTSGSSYNNPLSSRDGPEKINAILEVRGFEDRSLPHGQYGFPAKDRGWCENSLSYSYDHDNYNNGNGPHTTEIQQEPMWPGDGRERERIDRYRSIKPEDVDYRFPNEQNRFRGWHDNYTESVEMVDQRQSNDDFYPPEEYETAGGFGSDSRDNYQSNWLQDDRNFPTGRFGGYGIGSGRGRPGGRPELEGEEFGQKQPTRYSQEDISRHDNDDGIRQEHNRIGREQKFHHGREQEQEATVPDKRTHAEHNSSGFNQRGFKTSGNKDGAQKSTHQTDDPSNSRQRPTKSVRAKCDDDEAKEEGDDEDALFCKLCKMLFNSAEKFMRHTRGLLHTQRQMAADAEKRGVKLETAPERYRPPPKPQLAPAAGEPEKNSVTSTSSERNKPTAATVASVQEQSAAVSSSGLAMFGNEMGDDKKDRNGEKKVDGLASTVDEQGGSHCSLCDIDTTGTVSLRSHLNGHIHKLVAEAVANGTPISRQLARKLGPKAQIPENQKPVPASESGSSVLLELLKNVREALVGLKHIKEYQQGNQMVFYCIICESHCDSTSILTHLTGSKHRMRHLKEAHLDVYQYVKVHDGKKSELSAFLEEVCKDIEQKEGRGQPILEAVADGDKEKVKVGDKPTEKDGEKKAQEKKTVNDSKKERMETGPSTPVLHLPHEVVLSRYKEDKKRKEMMEQGLDPDAHVRSRDGPGYKEDKRRTEQGLDPDAHVQGRNGPGYKEDKKRTEMMKQGLDPDAHRQGRGDPGYKQGWNEAGPDFERGRSGQGLGKRDEFDPKRPRLNYNRDYSPQYNGSNMYKRGGPYQNQESFPPCEQKWSNGPPQPPHPDYPPAQQRLPPPPPLSEEERYRQMYAYERHNFFYPEVGINYDQARSRMFHEYERLGIPYKVACGRVQLQEKRRMRLLELKNDGLDFDDACNRVIAAENKRHLMQELEKQGLTPPEVKYRVIVQEERRKLFEGYEQKGISPQEACRKVMAGEDRMHLIREYERHGMPPDIAQEKAVAEEMRFRNFEESLMRGQDKRSCVSSKDKVLDDIAERNMLEAYMEQGIGREEAENKIIALLRQQGVPIQEAVKRVQSIVTKLKEKREQSRDEEMKRERSPDNHGTKRERNRDREEGSLKSRDRDRDVDHDDRVSRRCRDGLELRQSGEKSQTKYKKEDFDSFTPEEAKERLLKEYEKRGISREDACKALIGELIRSGIPADEAERRFVKSRHDKMDPYNSDRSSHRSKHGDRHRSRSGSPKGQRHRSGIEHRYGDSRSLSSHHPDLNKSFREKENRGSGPVDKEDRHLTRQEHDDHSRGALDGKYERSRDRWDEQEAKKLFCSTRTLGEELRMKKKGEALLSEGLSDVGLKLPKLLDSNYLGTKSQPAKACTSGHSRIDVSNLFETLTSNLISSKDDAAKAEQVSKALTSALLKYKLKPLSNEVQPSKSYDKRIEDAKKLLQTKLSAYGKQFPIYPKSGSQSSEGKAQPRSRTGAEQPETAARSARSQADHSSLLPRKPKVTFDPSTRTPESSQRAPWPHNKLSTLETRKIPIASQNLPSVQEANAPKVPLDPKRVLYEAQRQQRLERLSTVCQFNQPVQWGASHNIVVKSQNLSNKSKN